MTFRNCFYCALSLFLLSAQFVWAQDAEEITVEGSNFLKFDEGDEVDIASGLTHPDNLIARHYIENRLRLDLYRGNLRAGVRLLYFRPSDNDINQYGLFDESRVDKRFLEATYRPLILRLGHYSDLWANGLALTLFENRDLYFDSELDGVRSQLDLGPLTMIGMRGTSADGLLAKESEITAGRLQFNGSEAILGFSYVFNDSGYYPESHVSGLDMKYSSDALTLNLERAWDETFSTTTSSEGHGTYLSMILSRWNWSLLTEYKDYDYTWERPFQNPPVVYRELGPRLLQGRDPHVPTIRGEVGYQVELSGQPFSTTFATAHFHLLSARRENQSGLPRPTLQQEDRPFWEWFANIEQELPESRSLILELGMNESVATEWLERNWVQAIFTTPIRGNQELEFEIEELVLTDKVRDDEKFLDQLYSLSWRKGNFSLNGQIQLSNDEELKDREGDFWPSVEGAMTMAEGRHRMILFYGQERGGLKCSNGVCRPVQAFSGFRLSLESSL